MRRPSSPIAAFSSCVLSFISDQFLPDPENKFYLVEAVLLLWVGCQVVEQEGASISCKVFSEKYFLKSQVEEQVFPEKSNVDSRAGRCILTPEMLQNLWCRSRLLASPSP